MTHAARFKPPTLLFILLIAMPLAHLVLPITCVLGFPWSLIGLVPIAAGIALNIIADQLFKGHGCITACRGPDILVTRGPYALSRNPMYLGFALILTGAALMLGSLSPLLVALIFVPLTNHLFIKHEEAALAQIYAGDWPDYVAKVGRWV